MNETDIIEAVFRSNDFGSQEQAEAVTRATLRNLGRCLSVEEARDLAVLLPSGLSEELVDVERTRAKPFAYEGFLERVSEEADVSEQTARDAIHAVGDALSGVVPPDEIERAREQLPAGFDLLMGFEE